MGYRNRFATEYQSAPKRRLASGEATIDPTDFIDITALLPSQSELKPAPAFDLLVGFLDAVDGAPTLATATVAVAVTDDPTVADQDRPQYTYLGDEESAGIRVRGLPPRKDGGTVLVDWEGGEQHVLLWNLNPDDPVTLPWVAECPDLDWR